MVKKGQVLFRLDARSTRLGVSQAETGLQARPDRPRQRQARARATAAVGRQGHVAAAVLERAESAFNSAEQRGQPGLGRAVDGPPRHRRLGRHLADRRPRRPQVQGTSATGDDDAADHRRRDPGLNLSSRSGCGSPRPRCALVHVGDQVTAHFTRARRLARGQGRARPADRRRRFTRTIEIITDVEQDQRTNAPVPPRTPTDGSRAGTNGFFDRDRSNAGSDPA